MIAVLGAMDCEVQSLVERLRNPTMLRDGYFTFHRGTIGSHQVVLARTGVGKVLAASCAQKIIDTFSPRAMLCTGVAGALSSTLKQGDIVVSSDCIQHDLDAQPLGFKRGQIPYTEIREVHADSKLIAIAREYSSTAHATTVGRILSGDQFVTFSDHAVASHLKEELQGVAVEMEGASIGLVCHLNKVPFLVIRTISDSADGAAVLDFDRMKDVVAGNSLAVVEHILSRLI